MFQHSNQHQTLVCDNLFTTKNTIVENYKLLQKKQKKETDVSYRLHLTINHKCQLQPEAMELIDLKAFISYGYWLLTIIVIIIIISPLTLANCARSQERDPIREQECRKDKKGLRIVLYSFCHVLRLRNFYKLQNNKNS